MTPQFTLPSPHAQSLQRKKNDAHPFPLSRNTAPSARKTSLCLPAHLIYHIPKPISIITFPTPSQYHTIHTIYHAVPSQAHPNRYPAYIATKRYSTPWPHTHGTSPHKAAAKCADARQPHASCGWGCKVGFDQSVSLQEGKDYHSSCLLLERGRYEGMTPSGPTYLRSWQILQSWDCENEDVLGGGRVRR